MPLSPNKNARENFLSLYNAIHNDVQWKTKVPEESTIKLSDAFCKNRYSNILGLDLVVKDYINLK